MLASSLSELDSGDEPAKGESKSGANRKVGIAGGIICVAKDRTTILPPGDNHTYHDSGAAPHVFRSAISFITASLRQCSERKVLLADESTFTSPQIGDALLEFENASMGLKSALLISGLGYNLVSVGQFAGNGIKSTFLKTTIELFFIRAGFLIGYGTRDKPPRLFCATIPNGSDGYR